MEEVLGTKTRVIKDEENRDCVIIDTDLEPIVWGTVARALHIRRLVPQSELSKLQLSEYNDTDKKDAGITIIEEESPQKELDGSTELHAVTAAYE